MCVCLRMCRCGQNGSIVSMAFAASSAHTNTHTTHSQAFIELELFSGSQNINKIFSTFCQLGGSAFLLRFAAAVAFHIYVYSQRFGCLAMPIAPRNECARAATKQKMLQQRQRQNLASQLNRYGIVFKAKCAAKPKAFKPPGRTDCVPETSTCI